MTHKLFLGTAVVCSPFC